MLIPSLCEANSQESAFRTYALCNELRNTPGSHLKGVGVILTMVVKKAATTKIIRDQCKQVLGASLYKTEIPSGLSVNMSVTKHLRMLYGKNTAGCGGLWQGLRRTKGSACKDGGELKWQ